VQKDIDAAVHAGDMEEFSVAYINSFMARQQLCGVSCDAYRV
jgi:hypothetical protein